MYARSFLVGGSHVGRNGHLRTSAYLDMAADARNLYFADKGFLFESLLRSDVSPVVLREELDHFAEVRILQVLRFYLALAGRSEDGTRFRVRNVVRKPDGSMSARITSTIGWLDNAKRKLVPAPGPLIEVLESLDRTTDFNSMESAEGGHFPLVEK